MKRLLAIACVIGSLFASGTAAAAPAETIRVRLNGLQRGSIIEGTVSFSATASSAAGIKRLEVLIDGSVVASTEPSNLKQEVEVPYDWATMFRLGSAEHAPNGEYEVKVVATANGGADEQLVTRVVVDNAPAMPSGFVATAGTEQVQLSWQPNTEPDLLGYQIERMVAGDFVVVGETTETSYVDPVEPGEHQYRVIAIRNSVARSTGRPSLPSSEVTVSVAAPSTDAEGNPHFGVDPTGSVGGKTRGGGFKLPGGSFAPRGLPSGAALPGTVGLPSLPTMAGEPETPWGTYEEKLPYELPEGGVPLSASRRQFGETWTLLPSDGLRWVALGALMLAIAALLRLVARRLETLAGSPELKL